MKLRIKGGLREPQPDLYTNMLRYAPTPDGWAGWLCTGGEAGASSSRGASVDSSDSLSTGSAGGGAEDADEELVLDTESTAIHNPI